MSTFNSLEFDGVNSLDHGIYITGESVYNAPERDVESLEIAGRNGDYLLDKGRWKNIDVTYNAGAFGADQSEFAAKIRQFRNLLASRYGYHRLTDTYNPNEYRLGVFKNAVEVEASSYKRAGEFDLVFNCKPQRYLTSGETEMTVTSGQTINNPTLFDSSPLLEADGYGHIQIGDYNISIEDVVIGKVDVSDKITVQNQDLVRTWNINEAQYNAGDHVIINGINLKTAFTITNAATFLDYEPSGDRTMGIEYYNTIDNDATLSYSKSGKTANFGVAIPQIELTIGQNLSKTYRVRSTINVQTSANWQSQRLYDSYTITYTNGVLSISIDRMYFNQNGALSIANPRETCIIEMGYISGDSTLSILEGAVYIDCELGDAYQIKDGQYVSMNNTVVLGSDLPKLKSGTNVIAMDNTITDLKITPRWWEL